MENTPDQNIAKEYTIARLNAGNLAHLEQLYEAVYGRKVRQGFYKYKYDTAYTGITFVGYIAYNLQEEPVAYYGVIPCFIEYEGRSILAAQSADTMTHPGHRYKGMFAELSRLTFSLCRELGLRLVFGFPNRHSYPGAIRMGWKETETMIFFDVRIAALPLASLCARWPLLQTWYRSYRQSVIARYATTLPGVRNSVLNADAAGVQRSDAYLAYKKYNATQVLQIGEAKIWLKMGAILLVGDMEQVDENNFDGVMDKLQSICRRSGIRQLTFHISPNTRLYRLWSARYSPIPSYPVLFQDFGADVPLDKIRFTFADIDIF